MKVKRYKKLNRYLGFFLNNYGFRQPYQILVDGTFCYAALNVSTPRIFLSDSPADKISILTTGAHRWHMLRHSDL